MSEDDAARAAGARLTVDLVSAYCQSLPISPHELPALIRYVGAVVSRTGAQQPTVALERRDGAGSPSWEGFVYPNQRDPIDTGPAGADRIISLAEYRARWATRRWPDA